MRDIILASALALLAVGLVCSAATAGKMMADYDYNQREACDRAIDAAPLEMRPDHHWHKPNLRNIPACSYVLQHH